MNNKMKTETIDQNKQSIKNLKLSNNNGQTYLKITTQINQKSTFLTSYLFKVISILLRNLHNKLIQIKKIVIFFFLYKIVPLINQQAIQKRYNVVKMIKQGKIDEALQRIKGCENGQIFDQQAQKFQQQNQKIPSNQQQIIFCLKSLKVINLIQQKKLQNAIIQARQQLIPYAKKDIKYMPRIQEIMSLLVFPNLKQCSNFYLTTPQYRSKIAKQVNRLLLSTQNQALSLSKTFSPDLSYDSITELLKLTKWLQKRLENYLQFPKINLKSSQSDNMFIGNNKK